MGVKWKDGIFYPSGAKELDKALIEDNLIWLNKYPEAKEIYSTALRHFNSSLTDISKRKDAITNAYTSIENLAKLVLNNSSIFDKNSNELIKKLNLPTEYGRIFDPYKKIANEYSSRHDGSSFGHEETEAFVYLTGILMRLISSKLK